MKKILFIFLSLFILNGCTKNEPFYLNDEYYEKSEFVEIDNTKLKELENTGESFALVVYNSSNIDYNYNALDCYLIIRNSNVTIRYVVDNCELGVNNVYVSKMSGDSKTILSKIKKLIDETNGQ